jgi:60 kDa SS-A/Ro ribonucleoprotein
MAFLRKLFYGRTIGTPQTQAQPEREQVRNSAGGYVYALGDWDLVDRFLILGSEGGTYYAAERELTLSAAHHLAQMVREHGVALVERVVTLSESGRAPKASPAIFALAMAAGFGDDATRRAALAEGLQRVCRTGSQLLEFASYVEQFRGWGRGLRRAVVGWYERKPVGELAYQVAKYQSRSGFSHRDLLRLSHPVAHEAARAALYAWMARGTAPEAIAGLELIAALERAKELRDASPSQAAEFVRESRLPREALPTEWLRHSAVWEALLGEMPMTACIRNLATMTRLGLLTDGAAATSQVVERLRDAAWLRKARVHPIAVLAALETYRRGRGARGKSNWNPVRAIVEALDDAFYLAFQTLEPSGARMLVGLDVSASMSAGEVAGVAGLTPRVAAAAMAMTQLRSEREVRIMAFSDRFVELPFGREDRLERAVAFTNGLPFERTDCALPMLYALEQRLNVDTFVVYTDNETWAGSIHPDEALRRYRERTGIPAKLVVVGMTSSGFTIADPNDAGMLDVVGFDAAAPNVIAAFARPIVQTG